jgi:thiol-disulfide isomerase/thioredoxin
MLVHHERMISRQRKKRELNRFSSPTQVDEERGRNSSDLLDKTWFANSRKELMHRRMVRGGIALSWLVSGWVLVPGAIGATPTAERALSLQPVQPQVSYETPAASEVGKCKVEVVSQPGLAGWEVHNDKNQLLRRFIDSNGDKKIDQWCYYQDGIEVYRDVDSDFNEKADQYRWLGTAGLRWGLDKNEDGRIDQWKMISPEEVTAEVVEALRKRDTDAFLRVLLKPEELQALGLGKEREQELAKRIEEARTRFAPFAEKNKLVTDKSQWLHFGAQRPGIIPAGTSGSTKDLLLYDNAAAIIETEGKHSQVILGTLIHVNDGWRVLDLPSGEANVGFYTSVITRTPTDAQADLGVDQTMQELLGDLEAVDKKILSASAADLVKLNQQRADVLEKLAAESDTLKERDTWVRQFADTVSAATQSGQFPGGVVRLKKILDGLDPQRDGQDLVAFVKFRFLSSEYAEQMQKPDADFGAIQDRWLENLQAFVKSHGTSPDAAEVMLQLAIAQEFAGNQSEALQWYGRIVKDFPTTKLAEKAKGAKRRLESVGQLLELQGQTVDGKAFDLAQLSGRVVLVHYWATWCEPCKQDIQAIRELTAKYDNRKFVPVGVNLDHDRQPVDAFLRQNRLPWPQLYEGGGLDSRLANELGVLTLPTMLLIDQKGKVVRRNIHVGELSAELDRLLK